VYEPKAGGRAYADSKKAVLYDSGYSISRAIVGLYSGGYFDSQAKYNYQ
jgi:hypothetical protein